MLFVKDKSGATIGNEKLKIIDFGGSEFIDSSTYASSPDARNVANVFKMRQMIWSDDRYSSPEHKRACKLNDGKEEGQQVYPVGCKLLD